MEVSVSIKSRLKGADRSTHEQQPRAFGAQLAIEKVLLFTPGAATFINIYQVDDVSFPLMNRRR
jgi:hypothetical protein